MPNLRKIFSLKSTWRRLPDETNEEYVRRNQIPYVAPVIPSILELYDRVAALEARLAQLESRP